MDIRETYNKIAQNWAEDHKTDTWWIEGTRYFASMLSPGSLILDAGCGSGAKSAFFLERGFRVDGFDISEGLLEIARQQAPGANFFIDDFYEQKNLKTYDAIFAQASLLHIQKSRIAEVLRSLVSHILPGGLLYIAVKEQHPGQPAEEIKTENDYGFTYERFFSYYTMEELKDYFKQLGLNIVYEHAETSGKTRWLQLVGKVADQD